MMFFDLFRREPNLMTVPAGKYLFHEGDGTNELMYVLVAGRAEIHVGQTKVEDAQAGTIFGEMAMIDQEPRSASVLAITDCQFAEINRKRFQFLVTEAPSFATDVMRIMAERLRRTDRMLK